MAEFALVHGGRSLILASHGPLIVVDGGEMAMQVLCAWWGMWMLHMRLLVMLVLLWCKKKKEPGEIDFCKIEGRVERWRISPWCFLCPSFLLVSGLYRMRNGEKCC